MYFTNKLVTTSYRSNLVAKDGEPGHEAVFVGPAVAEGAVLLGEPLCVITVVPSEEVEVLSVGDHTGLNDVGVAAAVADGDVVAALVEALVVGEDEAGDVSLAGAGVALTAALEPDVDAVVGIEVDGESAVVVLDPAVFPVTGSKVLGVVELAAPHFGAVSGGRGGEGGEGCESERELHRGR